jgi:predicted transcriptional regulator of viral defense system
MEYLKLVNRLLDRGQGLVLTSDAVLAGLHRGQLSALVKTGQLEHAKRGVYIVAGGMVDELFTIQQRAKKIIYSHETALFLHGLTDRTPTQYSLTVPSSYKPSCAIKDACKVYYIKKELICLGKIEMPSGMGHIVISYDIERTICDIVRSRSKIDKQIFLDALKNYTRRKDTDLNRLYLYAKEFHIDKVLHQYLEVLL